MTEKMINVTIKSNKTKLTKFLKKSNWIPLMKYTFFVFEN